jgi:hypothetical protein
MPRRSAAADLGLLLAATAAGKLTPASARRWARQACAGQDISAVTRLAAAGDKPSRAAMSQLAGDLAAIFTSGDGPGLLPAAGELSNAEADLLFAPASREAAERRFTSIEAAARQARTLPDDALYDVLFGDHVYAAAVGEIVNHVPVTISEHTHPHSDYSGAVHSHPHGHNGDANHDPAVTLHLHDQGQ